MSKPDVLRSCANCTYRNCREIPVDLSENEYNRNPYIKRASTYLRLVGLFEPMGNGCHSLSNVKEKQGEMESLQERIHNSLKLGFDEEMSYRDFIQELQFWMETLAQKCTNFQ
ncbi:hypothetical protein GYA19_00800 [Candidatus Beckwithbacteria bacterium]|nr:hypothetical protein [Candidatus Beckwithbacteria bacterium]